MTNAAQKALERLIEDNQYNKHAMRDLKIIKMELDVSDTLCTAAMESSVRREITEAKIAALQEANKRLAAALLETSEKFDMLKRQLGEDRLATLLGAALFNERADAMKKMAAEARKEAEAGNGQH